MLVIKRRHQLYGFRTQQAVAKHIARHVTDTNYRDGLGLHIDTQLAEMPLHRYPGATGGNAHFLVVVTHRPTRGERIPQPEAIFFRQGVGDVGKRGGAFIRRHHQIGIIIILAFDIHRRCHLAIHQIIGNVQQTAHEGLIAGDTFCHDFIPVGRLGQIFGEESALCTHRYDHGIFHLLGFHQPQYFGAKILAPVGPAQAAPGHLATPQMHAFHPR